MRKQIRKDASFPEIIQLAELKFRPKQSCSRVLVLISRQFCLNKYNEVHLPSSGLSFTFHLFYQWEARSRNLLPLKLPRASRNMEKPSRVSGELSYHSLLPLSPNFKPIFYYMSISLHKDFLKSCCLGTWEWAGLPALSWFLGIGIASQGTTNER